MVCLFNTTASIIRKSRNKYEQCEMASTSSKSAIANIAGKVITPLIFILSKLFSNLSLYSIYTLLKHSISIKIIIMLSTTISPSLLYQTVGNLTLNLISPDSSYFFPGFTSTPNSDFLLINLLAPPSFSWIRRKTIDKSRIRHFSLHWGRYA